MQRAPRTTRRSRSTAVVAALTVAAITATTAPAAATEGTVLASGRRVGDVCVFDTPVTLDLPEGTMATATESCDLMTTVNLLVNVGPTVRVKPKTMRVSATPSGGVGVGGFPSVSVHDVTGLVGTVPQPDWTRVNSAVSSALGIVGNVAGDAAKEKDYYVVEALADWPFYDERGTEIYRDTMKVRYRRWKQDGNIHNAVPGEGVCRTGSLYPHSPSVGTCEWSPGAWGGYSLSFTSSGHYEDYVTGVRWDARDLQMEFEATSDGNGYMGSSGDCSPVTTMPVGWSTPGCTVMERFLTS